MGPRPVNSIECMQPHILCLAQNRANKASNHHHRSKRNQCSSSVSGSSFSKQQKYQCKRIDHHYHHHHTLIPNRTTAICMNSLRIFLFINLISKYFQFFMFFFILYFNVVYFVRFINNCMARTRDYLCIEGVYYLKEKVCLHSVQHRFLHYLMLLFQRFISVFYFPPSCVYSNCLQSFDCFEIHTETSHILEHA